MKNKKRAQRLSADERRAVTVQTVLELAAEQNPDEITTTAMAERMRMTQGALFRHFPTKDAIWEAVMEWVAERILARVDEAGRSAGTSLEALEAVFMAHMDFVTEHAGVPRILFGELQRRGDTRAKRMVRKLLAQYGKRLQAIIEQGKARGEVAPDVDPVAASALFIGTIQGLVMQSLLTGKGDGMRAQAAEVFAIYQRGIRSMP